MITTTIKVDSVTRDRLAHVARARGTTMGAMLSEVATDTAAAKEWPEYNR